MEDLPLLKPSLYSVTGTPDAPACPALLGADCNNCGHIFFPPQRYGCERCGSTRLGTRQLSGVGLLTAWARVHLHRSKSREAPFTIGTIALADGPVIRAIVEDKGEALRPGMRVGSALIIVEAEQAPALDLHFIAEA